MISPIKRSAVLLSALLFASATLAMAQETKKTIKKAPIERTSAASGEEMYKTYCAVCHGIDGKGDGPAASEFKTPPTNLTLLAQHFNGKFPEAYVAEVIKNGPKEAKKAHGSEDMPVWGPAFGSISGGARSPLVKLRISNLSKYLESMQAK
ncbi:MAG: cytochrome c [Acidobacteriia bacterium]|nr:cytochrome c [Terriglobia bacterium]